MNSIPDMIEALRGNPRVVGLAEYGSASHADEPIYGDYDVVVVADPGFPEIEASMSPTCSSTSRTSTQRLIQVSRRESRARLRKRCWRRSGGSGRTARC